MSSEKVIGRVVATERKPNTAYSFHFWTEMPSSVGIGTLVAVYTDRVKVYGVVVEGEGFTDLASALHDYLGSRGRPSSSAPTLRPEVHYYTAAVLRVEPEEPLQPVPIGPVVLADDEAVMRALRMDEFAAQSGIACGLYPNGEHQSPVYLDWDFVLGPESAHLNISGVSGLATKTSAIEFLIGSIFHTAERRQAVVAESERERYSVAVVCFNVKGPDLLFLDQPADVAPGHPLADRYATKGVPPIDEAQRTTKSPDRTEARPPWAQCLLRPPLSVLPPRLRGAASLLLVPSALAQAGPLSLICESSATLYNAVQPHWCGRRHWRAYYERVCSAQVTAPRGVVEAPVGLPRTWS